MANNIEYQEQNPVNNIQSNPKIHILSTLALLSGCCGLAYEVLYVRALTAILGDMFYVHAALLSTFLIGIGLGSKLAHRWVRWLWFFEIVTGLYALALPAISKWFAQQQLMATVTASPALTIITTIIFMAIPSLLIGFSIPLFSAYIKAISPDHLSFQGVYKIYNLGAFLSILTVELLLIRFFGITKSLAAIGFINLFNGFVLIFLKIVPTIKLTQSPRSFPKRIILALALGSLSSAVFQMFFLKLFYLVFHPHRENFAIGLAITMLGIFIGAILAARTKTRFESCLLLAALMIAAIYVGYMPLLKLFEATAPLFRKTELLILIHKFIFGCIFALGPMITLGALIPALMRTENEVAGESGLLLFVSSMANAVGYLVYVVLGHPFLQTDALLAILIATMLAASFIAVGFKWNKQHWIGAICSVLLITVLVTQWQERFFYLAHWVNKLKPEDDVIVYKSGGESATLARSEKGVWLSYNGHPSIFVQQKDGENFAEMMVGVMPALFAPRLDKALVIGLGTGITAGATTRVFKETDVVEINDAFYKMMPDLSFASLDIGTNPAANLHLSDGRAYLVGKDNTYDAILNTVSAPTYFSAAKIYTLEFYERVAKALKPNGVYTMWLAVGNMSENGIKTITSGLQKVFKYCRLTQLRGSYYTLTCSNQPIKMRSFDDLPVQPNLKRQLQLSLPGLDLNEFCEDIQLSENIFDHFEEKVPVENTDDHPVLEFMVVRDFQLNEMGRDPFFDRQELLNIDPVNASQINDMDRLAKRANTFYRLGGEAGLYFNNFKNMLSTKKDLVYRFFYHSSFYPLYKEEYDKAENLLKTAIHLSPDYYQAHTRLGKVYESQKLLEQAVNSYKKSLDINPGYIEAALCLGKLFASHNNFNNAVKVYNECISANTNKKTKSNLADVYLNLGYALKQTGKPNQSLEAFNKAVNAYNKILKDRPGLVNTLIKAADALENIGNFKDATKLFRKAVEVDPYDVNIHIKLANSLEKQKLYDDAALTLKKVVSLTSHLGASENAQKKLNDYISAFDKRNPVKNN